MVNLVAGKGSSFPGTSERGRRAKEGEALEGRGEVSARRLVLSVSARQRPLAEMIMRPVMAAERFTLSTDRYLHVSAQEKRNPPTAVQGGLACLQTSSAIESATMACMTRTTLAWDARTV